MVVFVNGLGFLHTCTDTTSETIRTCCSSRHVANSVFLHPEQESRILGIPIPSKCP